MGTALIGATIAAAAPHISHATALHAATPAGAVYAMTNARPGNAVVAYRRAASCWLTISPDERYV